MSSTQFRAFRLTATQFLVRDFHLYRRGGKNVPLRRVVDTPEEQAEITLRIHNEIGTHRGREATYNLV